MQTSGRWRVNYKSRNWYTETLAPPFYAPLSPSSSPPPHPHPHPLSLSLLVDQKAGSSGPICLSHCLQGLAAEHSLLLSKHTHVHKRAHTHVHKSADTHTQKCRHTHTKVQTHTHAHTHISLCSDCRKFRVICVPWSGCGCVLVTDERITARLQGSEVWPLQAYAIR